MRERREGGEGVRERREGGERGREGRQEEGSTPDNKVHQAAVARKPAKHRVGGASRTMKPSKSTNARGTSVHLVLPALLLGGVAVVVYFGELWLLGSGVNKPLPLPPAVSKEWRNDDVYLTRLWGTYR